MALVKVHMSRIATSIPTLRGLSAMRRADGIVNQALERLSTGKRINRASDDPAGAAAADGLRFQQTTLNKRITSAERQIHVFGAQEGALSVMSDLAIELRGLTVQAASTGGLTEGEREAIFEQAASIIKTADHIANTSTFAGEQILTGTSAKSLGFTKVLSAMREGNFDEAGEAAEGAVESLATRRGGIGNRIRELESMMRVNQAELEAITGELSRVEDADFARETAELVRGQILKEAAIHTTKIAAENAQSVLMLLESAAAASPKARPGGSS